jgi:hypothetical protein
MLGRVHSNGVRIAVIQEFREKYGSSHAQGHTMGKNCRFIAGEANW